MLYIKFEYGVDPNITTKNQVDKEFKLYDKS